MVLCGGGRCSPFDTICVGIGVSAEAASAPATRRCSRSLSQLAIGVSPFPVLVKPTDFPAVFAFCFLGCADRCGPGDAVVVNVASWSSGTASCAFAD
jgi:hypothetical protein